MKKITIAIDGHSSTGKSTVAKQLAEALDYIYVDTGAMYRAIALFAMREDLVSKGEILVDKLISRLNGIELQFRFDPQRKKAEMHLNGKNVEQAIRSMEVSNMVSKVAQISAVRAFLVQQQQGMGKGKGIVMDGRDIGTVVFPKAELKLFMTASAQTRAERRYEELLNKGEKVTFGQVLKNVRDRDEMDTNRKDSPLRKADDAIEIDNTSLSHKEQFDRIYALAQERIAAS